MFGAFADDRGQGLGEYAVILSLIAALCVGAVAFIGTQILSRYQDVNAAYP
ncbi:MAG: Flp/Fap pilin component [Candidatus Eremiobacteraeota bacterium]|jgi:Flp pilus assembly pilin Flp|nr:Flp/Fap pilin component [Candidatus Eremiobacteraeota bacterium]